MLTNAEIADYQRVGESQTEDLGLDFFRELCAQAREANALRAQLAEVQRQLAEATGPHCTGCGSAIDPDWCWCGSASKEHGRGDGHNPVSMGCSCHQSSDRDWIRRASLLREQAWRDRTQLAEARQLVSLLGNQLAEAMKVVNTALDWEASGYRPDLHGRLSDRLFDYRASHQPPTNVPALISSMEPATVDGEVKP